MYMSSKSTTLRFSIIHKVTQIFTKKEVTCLDTELTWPVPVCQENIQRHYSLQQHQPSAEVRAEYRCLHEPPEGEKFPEA